MTRPPAPRSSDPAPVPSPTPTPTSPAANSAPSDAGVVVGIGAEGHAGNDEPRPVRPLAGDRPDDRRRLPARVVACWRWTLLVAAVPSLLLFVALALLLPPELTLVVGAAWLLAALVLVGTAVAVVLVPPIRYAVFWYALSDDELEVGHGIVFRSRTVVPMQRVQSLRTERGPLARWFRLTSVRVRTAAGSVVINGLDEDEADRVCALIGRLANVRDDV